MARTRSDPEGEPIIESIVLREGRRFTLHSDFRDILIQESKAFGEIVLWFLQKERNIIVLANRSLEESGYGDDAKYEKIRKGELTKNNRLTLPTELEELKETTFTQGTNLYLFAFPENVASNPRSVYLLTKEEISSLLSINSNTIQKSTDNSTQELLDSLSDTPHFYG